MTNPAKIKQRTDRSAAPPARPNAAANIASTRARRARSDAFEAIHSAATGMFAIGAIDKRTMRDFDESCLVPLDLTAADVRRIRESAKLSQDVFARYLGTSKSTVQKWESSVNIPNPFAQRLMMAIDKHGLAILT
jgi:putative transcriptional regulator